MSKMFFEYYNGKYCRIPRNLTAELPSPNHILEYWVFKDTKINKYLKHVESEPGKPGYSFTADSHRDTDIVCIIPGGIGFSDMPEHSEDPNEVTLEYLGKDNIKLIPYFREIMWLNINGSKVYCDQRTTWDKFTIKALDTIPEIPEGKIWDGYYLESRKVDGNTVFQDWEAGSTIETRFKDRIFLKKFYVQDGHSEAGEIVEVTPNSSYKLNEKSPEGFEIDKISLDLDGEEVVTDTIEIKNFDISIFIHLTPYFTLNFVSIPEGLSITKRMLRGSVLESAPEELVMDKYELERLYINKDIVEFPYTVTENALITAKFTRPKKFSIFLQDPFKEIPGEYDTDKDVYHFYDIPTHNYVAGLEISASWRKYVFMIDKDNHLEIKADLILNNKTYNWLRAEPIDWIVYPTYVFDGEIVNGEKQVEITIPYSREKGCYYEPVSLEHYQYGDFEEPLDEVALTSRIYSNPMCTNAVINPTINGNDVFVSYTNGKIVLPPAYLAMDRKRTMNLDIGFTDTGVIEPKHWEIGTDQSITLSTDKFTEFTPPKDKVLKHFIYLNPYNGEERIYKLGEELKMEWSYTLTPIWSDPITATFIIDENDPEKNHVITADNCHSFTFSIPNIQPVKEGYAFIGWVGLPAVGNEFTITESTTFEPIWEPIQLLEV